MQSYTLNVNGKSQTIEADPTTPLLWVLRDQLDLAGTKFGCGIGQCGACTVHLDGAAIRSCLLSIAQIEGKEITTIEGLSEAGNHPVQEAWKEIDVPQCGYCQSGQMMTAAAFLNENKAPTTAEIRTAMHGNICRCATYNNIEKAVQVAAEKMS